ncbi:MAG TPA: hypothetical protein VEX35_01860 [Allosphingosinicella sp.]|nr:hypothetical protein [Allosphingosinicella sp.]
MTNTIPAQEQEDSTPSVDGDAVRALVICLQLSFTAENHDSLSDEITRLLLHLSQDRAEPQPSLDGQVNPPSLMTDFDP